VPCGYSGDSSSSSSSSGSGRPEGEKSGWKTRRINTVNILGRSGGCSAGGTVADLRRAGWSAAAGAGENTKMAPSNRSRRRGLETAPNDGLL